MTETTFPSLAFELRQFVLARLVEHRSALSALGEELASLFADEPHRTTITAATEAVRAYVSDRALVEATTLLGWHDHGGGDEASFRESLVYSLGLAAVGRVLDALGTPPGRPQEAAPTEAFGVLNRAYSLVDDASIR
jgi:hypothetical protein